VSRPLGGWSVAAVLACALLWAGPAPASIITTKHNLSASGPGTVKAATETQICVFCHAPHNSSPTVPLWNRFDPGSSYTPYSSSTSQANAGQPTGGSLACLSCHDGTIALGMVLTRDTPIPMAGGVSTMPADSPSLLGTDLSGDHPISFGYSSTLAAARGELVNPSVLTGVVRLDSAGQLQCSSCHDPHQDPYGKFLVMPNQASALCQVCHVKNYWSASDHKLSTKTWNGAGPNPWPSPRLSGTTVAANACESCHRPHTAPGKRWLQNAATEEDNCYPCHNANVAAKNIETEFTGKSYIHPVASYTGVHDPAELAVVQARHVECVDCHNPHASNASTGTPGGSLIGVRGVDISGAEVKPVTAEYPICFRCHADSTNKPAPHTTRQIAQSNLRLEFDLSNPSYHPVAGIGKNTNVPSLIPPWTTTSTMKCSDCHNNDTGPGAGGTGPNGPHGSIYPTLLERQDLTDNGTGESAAAYALCYKCHNRNSFIASTSTGFAGIRGHVLHVVSERTPCNICHDPHGISSTQGNSTNNSKLINFDTNIVKANNGTLRFVSTSPNRGNCTLVCHGQTHNAESYP
jgi:predicted CXXCH cytochrome family protein